MKCIFVIKICNHYNKHRIKSSLYFMILIFKNITIDT